MSKLKKRVYWAISENNFRYPDRKGLGDEMTLEDDLEMDKLDRVELLIWLEEDFDIEIEDYLYEKWTTIGDVVESVIAAGGT